MALPFVSIATGADGLSPHLLARVEIPPAYLVAGEAGPYGGDARIGDLNGDGRVEFLVYRNADAGAGDSLKPCFLGAMDLAGRPLWQVGQAGVQPSRPGPVVLHDLDGDKAEEIILLWHDGTVDSQPGTMAGLQMQVRDGRSGQVLRAGSVDAFDDCRGQGANWVHHRLLVCNLRGLERPRDFVIKLGNWVLALTDEFELLWRYENIWTAYQECPAYIPAVGDIDGDGRDEVNGGYFLLDDDGDVFWEGKIGRNMDSVAIAAWDDQKVRAICSGAGQVLDTLGNRILKLGEERVPHGQELRLGNFDFRFPAPQMVIRYAGHRPEVMLVDNTGRIQHQFTLNDSPNHTGMETIRWSGSAGPDLLFNGGQLWRGDGTRFAALPGLPPPQGNFRQGWYHAVPVDVSGDDRDEIFVYNPWDKLLFLYGPSDLDEAGWKPYQAGPRQYNARLLD